jgi:hypothetical protein
LELCFQLLNLLRQFFYLGQELFVLLLQLGTVRRTWGGLNTFAFRTARTVGDEFFISRLTHHR